MAYYGTAGTKSFLLRLFSSSSRFPCLVSLGCLAGAPARRAGAERLGGAWRLAASGGREAGGARVPRVVALP
jgi:hypothetical protein